MARNYSKLSPTVFNSWQFNVNTPQFLKEAAENCNGGMYAVCWNVFRVLIYQVAERAAELNDPILNTLMLRLNLYDVPIGDINKRIKELSEEWINKEGNFDSI